MKRTNLLVLLASIISLVSFTAKAEIVTIKAGTVVVANVEETVSSKNAKVGQSVTARLMSQIKAGGKVVIEAGTLVNAQINNADDAGCFGKNGELSLRLVSIYGPDGTQIPIQATMTTTGKNKVGLSVALGILVCPLFWIMHGGQAVIPAGTTIHGNVLANTDIELD